MIHDAVCTCCSAICCPHNIQDKFNDQADEMEKTIDRMLSKFDKKLLQDYIRDDGRDGQIFRHELPKSVYGSKSTMQRVSDHRTEVSLPHVESIRLKTMPERPHTADSSMVRPVKLHSDHKPQEVRTAWVDGADAPSRATLSVKERFSPHVASSKKKKHPSSSKVMVYDRLASSPYRPKPPKKSDRPRVTPGQGQDHDDETIWSAQGGRTLVSELPLQTAISVSLRHMVDAFTRMVLPWQAVLCRKAIESLRDLREQRVHEIYSAFISSMMDKLEEKEQTSEWGSAELKRWTEKQDSLKQQVNDFLTAEVSRQRERDKLQSVAQGSRDLFLASEIEAMEKEHTKQQLRDAKAACAGEKRVDKRMLTVTMHAAQSRATAQYSVVQRTVVKNREAAHEWLRCIADNAMTASIVEDGMSRFIKQFRKDKNKIYDFLKETRELYATQCSELVDTINTFCEGVVTQATDHICRERLVSRGFSLYLVELQTLRPDGQDEVREILTRDKHCAKRAERAEKLTLRRRLRLMSSFDEKRVILCRRVQEQFETANDQLLGNLRTRDAEIEGYLADINYTFRRFVQHSCNRRRQLHTVNIVKRKNFFRFEDECLSEMGSLLSNLRLGMEAAWRDEYSRMIIVIDGAQCRLDDMVRTCEDQLRDMYDNLSCNLGGDRCNIAWVGDAEKKLVMKEDERVFSVKQLRRKMNLEWVELLRRGIKQIVGIINKASFLPSPTASNIETDVTWAESFSDFGYKCATIANEFGEFIANRLEKERAVLTTTFTGQRDYLESNWKSNVVAMNNTLFSEVKSFFQFYCEIKDRLNRAVLEHETEAYCYEQGSLMRLEKFWEKVEESNHIFAAELRETLHSLVMQMKESSGSVSAVQRRAARKVLPFESEKSHFSRLTGKAYDVQDFEDKYYGGKSADNMSAYLAGIDTHQAENWDRKRSGLLAALQFDKIDVEKLFGDGNESTAIVNGKMSGDLDAGAQSGSGESAIGHGSQVASAERPLPMFKSVNEVLRYTVESIQVSRIRLLLKLTKSELQSLDARVKVQTYQNPTDRVRVYNRSSFDIMALSERGGRPLFSALASAALCCLQEQAFKFCESSKLIGATIQGLRVPTALDEAQLLSLMNMFSVSFAVNVISQMAQCNQCVDCQQIYEYIRRNIRQLCLTCLHTITIALHRAIVLQREGCTEPVDSSECLLVQAHSHRGLEEMMSCESSWMLTVFDIDEDFPGQATASDEWVVATKMTIAALEEWTPDEIRARRMKKKVNIDLLKLGNEGTALIGCKLGAPIASDPIDYSATKHRMTVKTELAQQQMLAAGVPDPDICIIAALLSDDSTRNEQLMDMTLETVQTAVMLWRFVAYCKLHTSTQLMHETEDDEAGLETISRASECGHEYDTLLSTLLRHDMLMRQANEKYDNGEFKIASMSPFDAVGAVVRRVGAITDVPLSFLQVICFLADKGGLLCEPWISEPMTFVGYVQFAPLASEFCRFLDVGLLWGFFERAGDWQSCALSSAALAPLFSDTAFSEMTQLNSGSSKQPIPLEMLRHFCTKNRGDGRSFTTVQLSMRFWCAYRANEVYVLRDADTITVSQSISGLAKHSTVIDSEGVEPIGRHGAIPQDLLEHLPKPSDDVEVEDNIHKNTKSVVELLEVGDTVDSFTDVIGSISDPSSSFLTSTLNEATGVLSVPLSVSTQRAVIAAATEHYPEILRPLQPSSCIWILSNSPVHVEKIKNMIALAQPQLRSAPKDFPSTVGSSITSPIFPSLAEIRRRTELSLLMQYCGGDCYDTSSEVTLVDYGDNPDDAGIGEYWKQLSRNRLRRIGTFTSSVRGLLSDYWCENLLENRTERHKGRVLAQQQLFSKFRNYVKAYRLETLRQREVLKELYSHINGHMITQQEIATQMIADIGYFFNYCLEYFERTLRTTLEGYKESKLAFLRQNSAVYESHKAMLNRVYARCRNALLALMQGQRDRFDEYVLKKLHSYVRSSASAGYSHFQFAADSTARLKNKFLTFVTNSWKEINDEVVKSLTHFEIRLCELLESWYGNEKLVDQAARSDHLLLRAEIKVSLDNAETTRGLQTKDVLRKYHLMENQLVGEILEARVGQTSHAEDRQRHHVPSSADNDDGSLEKDGSYSQQLTLHSRHTQSSFTSDIPQDADSVMSPTSKNATGNLFNLGEDGGESNLSLVKRMLRRAAKKAHEQLESERTNLCQVVKQNRKKRTHRLEKLRTNADSIRSSWEDVKNKLVNMISGFVLEAKSSKAVCKVDMWEQSEKFRKVDKKRLESLRVDVIAKNKKLLGEELVAYDEMDAIMFSRYHVDTTAIINNAQKELIEKKNSQPSLLLDFVRDIKARPSTLLDTLREMTFAFYEKYQDDDVVYQFMQTAESLCMCLDVVKTSCLHILKECREDQLASFARVRKEGDMKEALGDRIQVTGVMDILIDSIENQHRISGDINTQGIRAQKLNRELDNSITSFLSANTLPESFLSAEGVFPTEENEDQFGICKLLQGGFEHHGLCPRCIATLYATIHRNDVIVSAKLDAIYSHLAVLEAKQDDADRAAYLELFQDIASAHEVVTKEFEGLRMELVACLKEACMARDAYAGSNSLYNEVATSIKEMSIEVNSDHEDDEQGCGDGKLKVRKDTLQEEVMAELLRRAGAPVRGTVDNVCEGAGDASTEQHSDELTESDKIDFMFSSIIGSPSQLNLLAALNTEDVANKAGASAAGPHTGPVDSDSDFNILKAAMGSGADTSSAAEGGYDSSERLTSHWPGADSYSDTLAGVRHYQASQQMEVHRQDTGEEVDGQYYDKSQPEEEYPQDTGEEVDGQYYDNSQPEEEYPQDTREEDKNWSDTQLGSTGLAHGPYHQNEDSHVEDGAAAQVADDGFNVVEELLGRGDGKPHESFMVQSTPTTQPSGSSTPQRVPPLPLKLILPPHNEFHLPYGWEERATDEGTVFYFNTLTNDVSYDVHPSLFMNNGWRKCYTDDYEEYYYNDQTGESSWDAPQDAFDDDDSNCFQVTSDPEGSLGGSVFLSPRPPRPFVPQHNSTSTTSGKKQLKLLHSLSSLAYTIDITEGGTETDGSLGAGYMSNKSAFSYGAVYDMTVQNDTPSLQLPAHVGKFGKGTASNKSNSQDGSSRVGAASTATSKGSPHEADVDDYVDSYENYGADDTSAASRRKSGDMFAATDPYYEGAKSYDTLSDLAPSPTVSPANKHVRKISFAGGDSSNDAEDESERRGEGVVSAGSGRYENVPSSESPVKGPIHKLIHSGYSSNDGENDTSAPSSPDKPFRKGLTRELNYRRFSSNDGGDDTDGTDGQLLQLTHPKHHDIPVSSAYGRTNEDQTLEEPDTGLMDMSEFGSGSNDKLYNIDTPAMDAITTDFAAGCVSNAAFDYPAKMLDREPDREWPDVGSPVMTDEKLTAAHAGNDDTEKTSFDYAALAFGNGVESGMSESDVASRDNALQKGSASTTAIEPVAVRAPVESKDSGNSGEIIAEQSRWKERTDSYGMMYYESPSTGEVSWTLPTPQAAPANGGSDAVAIPTKRWQLLFTADGIPYYFNESTGDSQWTEPMTGPADPQLASALTASPLLTPVVTPRRKKVKDIRRTSLSVITVDDDEENGDGEGEDPYMISLLDFTPKRGSGQKKKKGPDFGNV